MDINATNYKEFMDSFKHNFFTDEEKQNLKFIIENTNTDDIKDLSTSILKGQYRLSYRLLERLSLLTTRRLDKERITYVYSSKTKSYEQKITKMELLLVIILLQMCDSNNRIYDFSYCKDIAPLKDCNGDALFSRSTFYYIYTSLQRKKLVAIKEETDGTITLSIPDNHIGKNDKYVSLQTEFLLHDSEQYLLFRNMKLAAMKIYLFCLAQTYTGAGKPINGSPAISVEQIKTRLGVTQNRTVRSYIACLEKAFGKLQFTAGGGRKAFTKGNVRFSNSNNKFCFAKRTVMSENQPNSFRRFFDKSIFEIGIDKCPHYDTLRTWTFMLLSSLKEDQIKNAFAFFISTILSHNKLDRLVFAEAAEKIVNAYGA